MSGLSHILLSKEYDKFWEKYKKKREKELVWESLHDALKKMSMMQFDEIVNTLTFDDIKRNIKRIKYILNMRDRNYDRKPPN